MMSLSCTLSTVSVFPASPSVPLVGRGVISSRILEVAVREKRSWMASEIRRRQNSGKRRAKGNSVAERRSREERLP